MLKRVLCGLGVAAAFLLLLLFGNAWMLVFLGVAVYTVAQNEFLFLAKAAGVPMRHWSVPVCGIAYLLATAAETPFFQSLYGEIEDGRVFTHFGVTPSEVILWFTPVLFLVIAVLRRRTERALEAFSLSIASFWYLAVLLGFFVRLALEWPDLATGRAAILFMLFVVKMSDAGAYFIGMRFGRKGPRLIPEISPAKSVIGLAGGFAFGIASGLLFALGVRHFPCGLPLTFGHAAVLGVVLTATGCLGDLAESLLKRSAHVKDSAAGVPGIGGILDMLDSPLFAAPVMYLYLRLFLLP